MRLLIFIIFSLTFFSCRENEKRITFEREIHKDKYGKPKYNFSINQQHAKELHLNNLLNGVDSLEIRIWVNYSTFTGRKLFIIKNCENQWNAKMYLLQGSGNHMDSFISDSIKQYNIFPKHGWEIFIKDLFKTDILTQQSIPDTITEKLADGTIYSVEVSTKYKYRCYIFVSPEFLQTTFPPATKMVDILRVIREGFGIKTFLDEGL